MKSPRLAIFAKQSEISSPAKEEPTRTAENDDLDLMFKDLEIK